MSRRASKQDSMEYNMPDDPTASDAEWKKIQKNTFTRWCNEHLKNVNLFIYNLETDLCDGLKLLALLQVLSHKKIRRYNKKPTFRPQKIENIAIALQFIEQEQIKLVNIDASDILKGNLKLILGLIWTLILKYQISLPMMDDDDEEASNITPKQALMGWVKSKLPPEIPVSNFTKDWNDGIALASLVESTAPGLFPEWEDLVPENALDNATEAMKRAEDWLGVPQVITPAEITNPNVDELSVMTYVSYFPEAKLKNGAPLRPKLTSASKCSAHGPGIEEHGVVVNNPANFTVTTSGSSKGKLNIQVFGPGRKMIDCAVQDNQDNTYSCQYVPPKEGTYDVHIRVGGHHIPKSPFRVNVSSDLDTSKVVAQGPGLEPNGVIVGRPAPFEVIATDAGSGDLSIDVIDPKGNKKTELKVEDIGGSHYKCVYNPVMVGRYVIVIKFGGKEVAKSPYHVNVTPAADRVKIHGPGLEPGLKTGKLATFTIDCCEAGEGPLAVNIEGPGRSNIVADIVSNGDGTHTCTYKPTKPGQYTISVKFDNALVPQCPVKVAVGTSADSSTKIKAWGPGLERGVAGRHAEFYVNCKNAPIENLTVGVEGPGDAKVEMIDTGDDTMTVKYLPTVPGKYIIHVRYEEMDIKESPYTAIISPRGDLSKVYAEGPGLLEGNMAGKPCEFTVFTKGAGVKTPSVQIAVVSDENGEEVECKVKDNMDGTFKCFYYPKVPGEYKVHIQFMDEPINQSPVCVHIKPFCDPSKVKASGPGLTGGKVKKPAQFSIDATKAGEGGIDVTIEGPTETEIKYDDHCDGTCGVEYMPVVEGEYKINVLFDNQHIPGSPFNAVISNEFDASKVKIDGPGLKPGNKAGKPCVVNIDTKRAGKAGVGYEVVDEENNPVEVELVEKEPGTYILTYHPVKEGTHTIVITFGGKPVPKSPAKVKINPSADGSKVKVFGPGVQPEGVKCEEETYFEIDASTAGDGKPEVTIISTSNAKDAPKVTDIRIEPGDKPNTFKVYYIGPREGEYTITVKYGGQNVPKSPFKIKVSPKLDASKCKAYGPGIEEPIVCRDNVFTVDVPKEAGEASLTVTIESPCGKKTPAKVTPNGKGGFDVCYHPDEKGPYRITIKFGGVDIPGSTFVVDVLSEPDPTKVKAYGPGLESAVSGVPAKFTIETKEAGPGDLGLTIEGPEEAPINCTDNGDGTCCVEYTPKTPGEYDVNILFDGVHIPGSPFKVGASEPVDVSKVKVKGPGVGKAVPASFPAEFTVDASKTGKAPLTVEVVGPNDQVYPCTVKDNGDKTFDCSYVPEKRGRYQVTPKYGGQTIPGAPFKVNGEPTGDASKVKCSGPGLEKPHPGHAAPFEVDTTKAGKGNPIINAKGPKGEPLPVKLVEEDKGVFACEYTPEELGPHEVEVLFGGNPVPGSTFKADATPCPELDKVKVQELEEVLEAGPCVEQEFEAPVDCSEVPDYKEAILTGKITIPSGKKEPVDVTDNHDGTFALNYTPKDVGKYVLDVGYDGIPIPGSPFEFEVTEGGPDKVNVYGKGIKKGVVAVPARFTVDTKNAGPGDLSVAVEGPSKVDIDCVDNGDGTCEVTYVPVEPGDYDVIVKFDNQSVPGSPFKPKVLQNEPAVEVGSPSDICLSPEGVSPKDLPSLKGVLASPSGKEKPVDLKEGPDDSIMASFVPDEPGFNQLHLKKNNKNVDGSPVPVLAREKPVIGQDSTVPLECNDCDLPKDLPKLKGVLTRPNGKDEPCKVEEGPDKTIAVTFVPEEPGKHLITVFKDNKQVEDSPYVVMVEGTPDQYPHVGQPCDKNFHQPEPCTRSDINKMVSVLRRPTGKEEPVDVKFGPDGTIAVSFIPTEAGEHLVSVKKDGHHVPHSPFSVMVIDEPTMPTVGSECAANFDIPELDLPKDLKLLTGTLTRPNGAEEPLELGTGPDDSLAVNFIPTEPGKHIIGIKKRGKHVKDSPFEIMVGEAKPKSKGPTVGQDCAANLDCKDVHLPEDLKDLKGVVECPDGNEKPVKLATSPDGTLDVNFTPEMPGEHLVHVFKKDKEIKDSPFSIMVEDGEPTGPTVGRECGVNLDIPELNLPNDLKNVTGELTRPNGEKEKLDCDLGPDETLGVAFTPIEPGKHLIDIKKRGRPVKGSPFEVDVAPASGPQVEEEIMPCIQDEVESVPYFVDQEFLDKDEPATVGSPCLHSLGVPAPDNVKKLDGTIKTPSGTKQPADLQKAPDGSLAVEFMPEEPGPHVVDVKDDKGKPIPGSPFTILAEEPGTKPRVGEPCNLDKHVPDVKLPHDLDHLKATVTAPSGKEGPVTCTTTPDDNLGLEFTPEEPGKHVIDVLKDGHPVAGSPFEVIVEEEAPKVGEPCNVAKSIPELRLPEDLKHLAAVVTSPSGKQSPAECTANPDQTLGLEFTPEEAGPHRIDVKNRGRDVKGSPFEVIVEENEDLPKVGEPCNVEKAPSDVALPRDLKDLKAVVTSPSGNKLPAECKVTPDKTLDLEFVPEEPGKHIIDVTKRGKPVKGSPFEVIIQDNEDLPKVHEPCNLGKDIDNVTLPRDLKDLKATVTSPSGKKAPVECTTNPDKTLGLEFTPEEPGKHTIDVLKRGRPVEGSPFVVIIGEEEPILPKVGDVCELDYEIPEVTLPADLKDLKAIVTRPSGKKDPIECTSTPDNHLGLEFTPEEPGKHVIEVTKRGRPVQGSPFEVIVSEEEPTKPKVGDKCDLDYDIPDVVLPDDLKDLKATVTRPSGQKDDVPCTCTPDNTLALEFTPEEPGQHTIEVTKKGKPVKGSPFVVVVDEDKPTPKVGDKCDLDYNIPDVTLPKDLKDLKATVKRPSGKKEPITCTSTPDNTLGLEFTPCEPGKHIIEVTKKGKSVKGSPFVVIVEEDVPCKPTVGNKCEVDYDIPEVSLPRDLKDLKASVTRPSGKKEPIACSVTPDNTLGLEFTPQEPGKHIVEVLKRGKPVKGSPFEIIVEEDTTTGSKPTVGHKCDVDFDIPEIVLPRDLKEVKAKLIRPDRTEEFIKCTTSPDKTLGLEFTPKQPGEHKIIVTKHGKPVKGSPFIILVEEDTDTVAEAKPTVGNKCEVDFDIPDVHLPSDLKHLKAKLTRPTGVKEEITCTSSPDNTLGLEFTPKEPGKHVIEVTKHNKSVKGSPFVVMVEEDTSGDSKPTVGHKCDVDFDIPDVKLPGDIKLLKATLTRPNGKKEPVECTSTPDNTLGLEFTPNEPGQHMIEVTKNNRPVKGSPFIVLVEEDTSPTSKPCVGHKCDVDFEIPDVHLPGDLDSLTATLKRPSGIEEAIDCTVTPDNTLGLEFTPKQPGKHVIEVKKNGRPVKGSPFIVMVEDEVAPDSKPTVGHKCDVDFDIPDVTLPRDLKDLKASLRRPSGVTEEITCCVSLDNTLGLEFTPKEPGKHVIAVTKKGRPVKGSPFEVMVEVDESAPKVPTVGSECDVNLEIPGMDLKREFKYLKGTLKRPGKNVEEPLTLKLNPNNTIGIVFVPEQVGRHEVSIKKNGKHVPGSPFEVIVHEVPSDQQGPRIGVPVDLSLDITITQNDLRVMKATITRPNGTEEPLDLKINDLGQPIVTFTPDEAGLHKVNIKKNGRHVPGSPIEVMVSQGKKKPTCDVGFEIPGIRLPDDLKFLKGSVVSPSGTEENVDLQLGPNNTIVVSFLPKEVGTHYIHIKKSGKHIGDSPYEVVVKPEDVAPGKPDASKVKCTGRGLRGGCPSETAAFVVDTRDAGYGGLGLSVEGPSKVEINCVDNEDGTCSVDYTPTEPGTYLINVTYADAHVPGSPFKCRISPDGMPIGEDEIQCLIEGDLHSEAPGGEFSDMLAFPSSKARSPQDFVIKFSGTGDLKASVTRPSGIEDDAEVVETGPDTYTVRFVPRETGEHLVNVKSRRRHIPGSPFKVIVEAPAGGANACKAYGPGLEGGNAGQPCKFTVITRDAGPGGLAVAVEGPAKAEIQCHDNGDGSCDITWYPVESGEYTIHIRFADEAIPGSPYKVFVQPADEGKAMSMENFKDQVLRVGQQASFAVQMKGKKGKITASVTSPTGAQIDCNVAELDEGNYAVRFVPRELGDHLVSVFLDGHHIPGSPFTVKVGGLEGDPSKVVAYGPGLKGGLVGKPAEFTVNALDAGSGALALSIDGPAKVKMNCVEQDDGTYKVIYNPTVSGIYEISIRFAGQHIPGSAYKVHIAANEDELDTCSILGDASKCTSEGLGLRKAHIGEAASFTVDASNAGRGAIMVGVEGPVIPAKEIVVKHAGGNVYSVNYVLEENGEYILQVLWAGKHIPGSPFHLTV